MKVVDYEYIVRLIQPRLTVLITSSSKQGNAVMAAAWITPLSYIPPIIGVSIARDRFTYKIIKESKFFAVNILDFYYVDNIARAGSISGYKVDDKFEVCGLTAVPGLKTPINVVNEAIGILECKTLKIENYGDHDFIVGEVLCGYAKKDFNTYWLLEDYNPVFYVSEGHFYTIDKSSLKKYEL